MAPPIAIMLICLGLRLLCVSSSIGSIGSPTYTSRSPCFSLSEAYWSATGSLICELISAACDMARKVVGFSTGFEWHEAGDGAGNGRVGWCWTDGMGREGGKGIDEEL